MINQNTPLSFFRLFSPMEGELLEADDTGIVGDNTIALTAYETVDYTRYVKKEIRHMPMASDGLVSAIQNEAIRGRIASMFPTVEAYGGRLWGVLEVRTAGRLTSGEMKMLQDEWRMQAKNGWGKIFEEQPIHTPQGELHVQFYNEGPDYSIRMEQELKGGQTKMQVTIAADEFKEKRVYKGAAVELPASRFELDDALQRAHVPEDGSYKLQRFIQWPGFLSGYLASSGDKTLEEVNLLAQKISRMDETQLETYEGALQLRRDENIDMPVSMKELINYTYNLDAFEFHPGVVEDGDLGEIAMMGGMFDIVDDLPEEVADLLDARKVGEALRRSDQGAFTRRGYIFPNSKSWQEVYDGVHLPEQPEESGLISLRLEPVSSTPEENSGVWLELPADEQAMHWALTSLGETSPDCCVIAEATSILPSLKHQIAGDEDIGKLNTLAERLAAFPDNRTLMKYKAVLELECFPDLDRMLDITQNLDCYEYDPVIRTAADYAEYLLCEAGFDTSDPAFDRFDFDGYGERQLERNGFVPTAYGSIGHNELPFEQEFTKPRQGLTMT